MTDFFNKTNQILYNLIAQKMYLTYKVDVSALPIVFCGFSEGKIEITRENSRETTDGWKSIVLLLGK